MISFPYSTWNVCKSGFLRITKELLRSDPVFSPLSSFFQPFLISSHWTYFTFLLFTPKIWFLQNIQFRLLISAFSFFLPSLYSVLSSSSSSFSHFVCLLLFFPMDSSAVFVQIKLNSNAISVFISTLIVLKIMDASLSGLNYTLISLIAIGKIFNDINRPNLMICFYFFFMLH